MTYFSCIFQIIKTLMITITDESMLYKELIEWKTAIIVSEKEYISHFYQKLSNNYDKDSNGLIIKIDTKQLYYAIQLSVPTRMGQKTAKTR